MESNEFSTLTRVLELMEKAHKDRIVSDLLIEFQAELTDEQIDMLLARFWFHRNRTEKTIIEEEGKQIPLKEEFDYL